MIINQKKAFPIWSDTPELQQKQKSAEQESFLWNYRVIRNVTEPVLIPYYPEKQNGASIIICPGGIFQFLMIDKEGTDVAEWLNSYGITAFILKYRLAPTPRDDSQFISDFESPSFDLDKLKSHIDNSYADAEQAVSIVKNNAADFKIDKNKVGIIGFSAGAVIAVNSALNQDKASCPDFIGAIYGAPAEKLTIPSHAPPLFIAYANDDDLASMPCNNLFQTWKKSKHNVEVHVYSKGGHGFGLQKQGFSSDTWAENFISWLEYEDFIPSCKI